MARTGGIALLLVCAVAGVVAIAGAQGDKTVGRIGPDTRIQPNGRQLVPAGKVSVALGNLAAGGAMTPDGRFVWTLSAGRGRNDVRIVQVRSTTRCRKGRRGRACRVKRRAKTARVVQVLPMPGLSGGMAFSPDGHHAYVSGVAESGHADEKTPADVPGKEGDVIHVFAVNAKTGLATREGVISVPPPSDGPMVQDFPPATNRLAWPRDIAVSPDGATLLVALNLADRAAIVDVKAKAVRYVTVGGYPYGAAITRDGKRGLVTSETDGNLSVIDMAAGTVEKTFQIGPHLSHPEGIAIDPKAARAYVAIANSDQVAVVDTDKLTLERTLSAGRPEGLGTSPVALSVTPDGSRLLVANSGDDNIAVYALPGAKLAKKELTALRKARQAAPVDWELIGRIPTAAYPTGAWATPDGSRYTWLSAKGLGVGPNVTQTNPLDPKNDDNHQYSYAYLPTLVTGRVGVLTTPDVLRLRRYDAVSARERMPTNRQPAPDGTPIRPGGPIKHVFYVVRENRTYDQIFGDDPRGDGDPKLSVFGEKDTPNAHALARRFGLIDHVFANSEASIDGHFWTSAGTVSDYVVKAWHQNYGHRGRPYDFGVYAVTWPGSKFIFDSAEKQGVTYFNYGEAIAGTVPLSDRNRTSDENAQVLQKFGKSDLGALGAGATTGLQCYPNDASIGKDAITSQGGGREEVFDSSLPQGAPAGSESRIDCFRTHFRGQLQMGNVPSMNYLVISNDHTEGTSPGARTPKAMIADNDYALGQLVEEISHSPIWSSSLILVVEDDSQDGADHVDAHRIPALAISPFSRRGAVVHTRYDFPSVIRTLELPLSMKPMNLFDANATPMYDVFSKTPDNGEEYTAIKPAQDLLARNTARSADAALSARVVTGTDETPQRVLDRILWHDAYGMDSEPPPPGPNAAREESGEEDR